MQFVALACGVSCKCTIFADASRIRETFRGLMTVYKVIPLEAIHDMNELTFHGNTKVGPIAEKPSSAP